jgi:multicomponent Na+:H+ antiporter subunit D
VETTGSEEEAEVGGLLQRVPLTMLAPIVLLLTGALALGVVPGVAAAFGAAADRFGDRAGYLTQTLGAVPTGPLAAVGPAAHGGWTASGVALGLVSSALAALFAATALYRDRLPTVATTLGRRVSPVLNGLRAAHSGHVGDYVTWLFVGVAVLCGFLVFPLLR